MRQIQYAYHREGGYVVSRIGSELAWPILDYEAIGRNGDYTAALQYVLGKVPVVSAQEWHLLVWTRFLPVEHKNRHRRFWDLPELPVPSLPKTVRQLCRRHRVTRYLIQPLFISRWADRNVLMRRRRRVVGICHGTWGSPVCLYHWFYPTDAGYVLSHITDNVDDEHKTAEWVKLRTPERQVTRY